MHCQCLCESVCADYMIQHVINHSAPMTEVLFAGTLISAQVPTDCYMLHKFNKARKVHLVYWPTRSVSHYSSSETFQWLNGHKASFVSTLHYTNQQQTNNIQQKSLPENINNHDATISLLAGCSPLYSG